MKYRGKEDFEQKWTLKKKLYERWSLSAWDPFGIWACNVGNQQSDYRSSVSQPLRINGLNTTLESKILLACQECHCCTHHKWPRMQQYSKAQTKMTPAIQSTAGSNSILLANMFDRNWHHYIWHDLKVAEIWIKWQNQRSRNCMKWIDLEA